MNALKAKFVGVSESVLGRIADILGRTAKTAEQVKAAVDAYTWQQMIDSYADSRATEATQTAVHNYEAKYGLKDGIKQGNGGNNAPMTVPPTGGTETKQGGMQEVPAWANALLEQNKALTDRLTKMEMERTTSTRKQQLAGVIDKLPENLRKAYGRTPVDNISDEEFTTLLNEVQNEVNGIVQTSQQKGAVFGRPNTAGGSSVNGELSKEQEAAIAHRNSAPADGQPF